MKDLLSSLVDWQIGHPKTVLGFLFAVTLILLSFAAGVQFDFTIEHLFAQNDPDVEDYFQFRDDFGREDNLIYLAYVTPDPFSYDNLVITKDVTSQIERIEGISEVTSLTNVELFQAISQSGEETDEILLKPVFQTIPREIDSLNALRRRILSSTITMDNLVSRDGKVAAIVVAVEESYNNHDDRDRILKKIDDIQSEAEWEWHEAGIPVLRTRYVQYMLEDLFRFMGPVTAIMLGVLFLMFRSWPGILLPMGTVIMADIWTIGIMALLGIDINIVTYIVPTLILIIGVADSIHILVKYHEESSHTGDKLEAVAHTLTRIGAAIFLTSITTSAGFLSLLSTNIQVVRQFGLMVGIGVVLAFVTSILFIPCMLTLLKKPSEARLYRSTQTVRHRFISWATKVNNRYQIPIIVSSLGAVILCSILAIRVDTHSSLMDDLKGDNRLYRDMMFMEERMANVLPLEVVVTSRANAHPAEDGIKELSVLKQISQFQEMLSTVRHVGKTVSIVDYLKEIHLAMNGGDSAFHAIPDRRPTVAQYLLLYEGQLDFLVNLDYSSTRISARIEDVSSKRAEEMVRQIVGWSDKNLNEDLQIKLTGTTLVALKTNQYLVKNLLISFIIAFGVIFLSMLGLFRSMKLASLSTVANFIPLLTMAGIMGLFHIKLRPTTAMTFAIAFGIAVDDTIHFLARFRQELLASHGKYRDANEKTLLTTGKALVSTSAILIAGFLVMTVSNFTPSRDFGFLCAVTLVGALIGDLFFLPSVLTRIRPRIPFLKQSGGEN